MKRENFSITFDGFAGRRILLNGYTLRNPGKIPLILVPGLTQNAFIYDLIPGKISLAEYLFANGYDLWLIHPRGMGTSPGKQSAFSLDDFAAQDVPAIIAHVRNQTGMQPIYVGQSEGGIVAYLSLLGAVKKNTGLAHVDAAQGRERQKMLRGLVTTGSFPDMMFRKPGLFVKAAESRFAPALLTLMSLCSFWGGILPLWLRNLLTLNIFAKILLFPLYLFEAGIALLPVWKFLYNPLNVGAASRIANYLRTQDGIFWATLKQYYQAVLYRAMYSENLSVNYSDHYANIALPCSVVAMEDDSMADPVLMEKILFSQLGGTQKTFTYWPKVGHEDHFMNADYFPRVLEAIQKIK